MREKRWGLWLAFASLAVNAPRLMLVYMRADGLVPPTWFEVAVISLSGIANGIVLAGAGVVIAHTLAKANVPNVHPLVRPLMLATWIASLAFAVVLITPSFVAGIRGTPLSQVIAGPILQWTWSAVAVVAVEVAAAGCMLADAALNARSKSLRATVEPKIVALTIACPACGKEIKNTTNAKNAHQRFCKSRESGVDHGDASSRTARSI